MVTGPVLIIILVHSYTCLVVTCYLDSAEGVREASSLLMLAFSVSSTRAWQISNIDDKIIWWYIRETELILGEVYFASRQWFNKRKQKTNKRLIWTCSCCVKTCPLCSLRHAAKDSAPYSEYNFSLLSAHLATSEFIL